MAHTYFLHGVPDTPHIWQPLIRALDLAETDYTAPALPGFIAPPPVGFSSTKEAYVDWYIDLIGQNIERTGPVNLIGHDWGALITVRVASLRPEWVKSWCVANALPHPDYSWHRMAKLWQTPIIGELVMAATRKEAMCKALHTAGLPADVASTEAAHWRPHMRNAILKLYRSAKTAGADWWADLTSLPGETGLVFWGDNDPYVPVWVAESFCKHTGTRLLRQADTGHWSVVQRADILADTLRASRIASD